MFNSTVTVEVGSVTTSYALTSIVDGKSQRSNALAPNGAPDILTISHETKGKGSTAVDRHLVRLDTTYVDSSSEVSTAATATAYVVLVAPHSVVTKENIKTAYEKIAAFLTATESGASASNLERVLNNEP